MGQQPGRGLRVISRVTPWANLKPSDDERFKGIVKLAYEYFKPEEMSDSLEKCLIDILGS